MKYLIIIACAISFLSGCSTHLTNVEYKGFGVSTVSEESLINNVIVTDKRGTDSDWLGAIRGGYGNRLKTLRTQESTDIVVNKVYTDALIKSNLYTSSKDSPYSLKIEITKFDCSYYFNREAHAHVNILLIDNITSATKFSKTYKTDEVESGFGAGIFGDVDTLRNLAETAMNKTVDKTLTDPEFIEALSSKESNVSVQ